MPIFWPNRTYHILRELRRWLPVWMVASWCRSIWSGINIWRNIHVLSLLKTIRVRVQVYPYLNKTIAKCVAVHFLGKQIRDIWVCNKLMFDHIVTRPSPPHFYFRCRPLPPPLKLRPGHCWLPPLENRSKSSHQDNIQFFHSTSVRNSNYQCGKSVILDEKKRKESSPSRTTGSTLVSKKMNQ